MQAASTAPSRLHSNVAGSSALNVNDALVEVVGLVGWLSIVVCGGVSSATASIVQVKLAGVASVPCVSVARTWKVCDPSDRPVYGLGLVQAANPPASSWHSKVEGAVALKVKDASAELLGSDGWVTIEVSGGAVGAEVQPGNLNEPIRVCQFSPVAA